MVNAYTGEKRAPMVCHDLAASKNNGFAGRLQRERDGAPDLREWVLCRISPERRAWFGEPKQSRGTRPLTKKAGRRATARCGRPCPILEAMHVRMVDRRAPPFAVQTLRRTVAASALDRWRPYARSRRRHWAKATYDRRALSGDRANRSGQAIAKESGHPASIRPVEPQS